MHAADFTHGVGKLRDLLAPRGHCLEHLVGHGETVDEASRVVLGACAFKVKGVGLLHGLAVCPEALRKDHERLVLLRGACARKFPGGLPRAAANVEHQGVKVDGGGRRSVFVSHFFERTEPEAFLERAPRGRSPPQCINDGRVALQGKRELLRQKARKARELHPGIGVAVGDDEPL